MMHSFQKGDKVEVLIRTHRNDEAGEPIWFSGTVLRSPAAANRKTQIYVEFETLLAAEGECAECLDDQLVPKPRLRGYVEVADVRPAQPVELHRFFKVGEVVEVFCGVKKGWRKAEVFDILENSKYTVSFCNSTNGGGERVMEEMEQWNLRVFRDWDDGSWLPPFKPEKVSPQSERNSSSIKLRVKSTSYAKFIEGMVVEVNGQKEGDFQESWYVATIVKSLRNYKFLVEYETLRMEDKSQVVMEEVDVLDIRPSPPVTEQVEPFECFEQVDAWYKDGWWVGHISEVIDGENYIFCFKNTNEEMEFEQSNLRPHQDWFDGNWIAASSIVSSSREAKTKKLKVRIKCAGKTSDLKKGSMVEMSSSHVATPSAKQLNMTITSHGKISEQMFSKGMMVEVKSNEQGYLGSLYTAQIVGRIGDGKYLVEYQTLRTEDESELLIETAESSFIRPCPPQITKVDRYKMLEEVDAWYNDGWWIGLISRVLGTRGYAVYFWTTNEELEFHHRDLRPHQEWIGGKWTTAFRKKSELPMNCKLGRVSGPKGNSAVVACFLNESRVEVTSDEEGYKDCWYPAKVLRPVKYSKYLVEYATLKTDDKTKLLKQEVDAVCLRPSPLLISQSERFKSPEEVDAWYNEGWWVGLVCEVTKDSKYMVYLKTTKEVVEFQHSDLRPHQDWLNQKWICPLKGRH